MKQTLRSKLSYEKILNAAIAEFGVRNYENASLNNICNDNKISKGLIYHHFENKDALFLCCVKTCYEELIKHLSTTEYIHDDCRANLKQLIDLRYAFFQGHPYFSNIFFNTILSPPKHLSYEIKLLRNEFDEFNIRQYNEIIHSVTLRDGVSSELALDYFLTFQEAFNIFFQNKFFNGSDLDDIIENHEKKLYEFLNVMLYGIAKEN